MKIGDVVDKSARHFNLDSISPGDFESFTEFLRDSGYLEENVFNKLGARDIDGIQAKYLPVYTRIELAENSVLDQLIKLFLLARRVPLQDVENVFDESTLQLLLKSKLLRKDENEILSPVDLFPCKGHYFATDHAFTDIFLYRHVYPLGVDSYCLARGMVKAPVESTLDLCTGSGAQGILASEFSKRVTCVDVNPRSLNFARFNAILNNRSNIEFIKGDLYQAVKDRKFDLILANPPFVPSPERRVYYRDGSNTGEGTLQKIISGLPRYLEDNGRAQIVTLLVYTDENYNAKVKRWLGEDPFHVLTLSGPDLDVDSYIISHMDLYKSYAEYSDKLVKWTRAYRNAGIINLSDGLINIKRSSNPQKQLVEEKKFMVKPVDFSHNIKEWFETAEIYEDNSLFGKTLKKKLYPGKEVDFWWSGKKPGGEEKYGVVYTGNSIYFEEPLDFHQKLILDLIDNGGSTGEEIFSQFVSKKEFTEEKQSRQIFRDSLVKLMAAGIVETS